MKNDAARASKAEDLRLCGLTETKKLKAFSLLLAAAKLGDEEAQVEIGYDFAYGMTVDCDTAEALRWWKRAYKQGSWAAAFNLGMFYRDAREWMKAVKWFERAVEAGDEDGLVEVAKIHLRYGGDRDAGLRSLKLAEKAKKRLTEPARLDLKRIATEQAGLTRGELLHREADLLDEKGQYAEALPLLKQGAEMGDVGCQLLLGSYLTEGMKGVPACREEGMYWYEQAYKAGSLAATFNIGLQHLSEGDFDESVVWFERAVEMGDHSSHLQLAKIWLRHRGSKKKAIEHLKAMFISDAKSGVAISEMDRDAARTMLRRLEKSSGGTY